MSQKINAKKPINKKIKFIAILVIAMSLIIIVINLSTKKSKELREISKINYMKSKDAEYILPSNYYELLKKYNGELSDDAIFGMMYRVVSEYVPSLRKEVIQDTEAYYNLNKDYIYVTLGIDNFEDFNNFIKKVNSISTTRPEFTSYEIKDYSPLRKGKYIYAKVIATYNEKDKIEFEVYVYTEKKKDSTSVAFK